MTPIRRLSIDLIRIRESADSPYMRIEEYDDWANRAEDLIQELYKKAYTPSNLHTEKCDCLQCVPF